MKVLHPTSGSADHAGRTVVLRMLRSACWMFFANPLAFIVAGLCFWLLGCLLLSVYQAQAAGAEWRLWEVLGYGGGIIGLTFLACLAVGHIALMWIAGWRSGGR